MTTIPALILTKRLRMRSYHAGMVSDRHIAWLNDKDVVKYSEQRHREHTIESQHIYLNSLWKNQNANIWMIALRDGNKEIGTLTAYFDYHNRVVDMGILLGDKNEWQKGYGLEAWSTIMNTCIVTGARKIECGCMKSNLSMGALAKKAGMDLECKRPDHFMLDGKPEDLYMYGWRK